jgi:3',5'-cyclic-AMP phosphodiesterase
LEQTLAASEQPTLILMHHPPFVTGIAHMDAIGLSGRDAFASIVSRHSQVQAILCGHLHRNIQTLVGGRRALCAPSPAHQVALDLRSDGPSCFRMEPPGYLLHLWKGGALVSHAAVIGGYDGPYPFFDKDGHLID